MSFSSSSSAPVGYSRTENPSISSANFRELRTAGSSSITRTTGLTLANSRWVIIILFPSPRDGHRGKDSISHTCAQVALTKVNGAIAIREGYSPGDTRFHRPDHQRHTYQLRYTSCLH